MACSVSVGADVLERAGELLGAASRLGSLEAFRAVVTDGIVRCLPEVSVTLSEDGPVADGHVRVALDPSTSSRIALVVSSERGFLCPTELDLLALLAPHLRDAYREACVLAVLTPRQREVLLLVGTGLTNRQVARRLQISPGTVRAHLEHSYERLGVGTRTAAIARAGLMRLTTAPLPSRPAV